MAESLRPCSELRRRIRESLLPKADCSRRLRPSKYALARPVPHAVHTSRMPAWRRRKSCKAMVEFIYTPTGSKDFRYLWLRAELAITGGEHDENPKLNRLLEFKRNNWQETFWRWGTGVPTLAPNGLSRQSCTGTATAWLPHHFTQLLRSFDSHA